MISHLQCIVKVYLVWTEDVRVVVKVAKCTESVFVFLKLHKAVT